MEGTRILRVADAWSRKLDVASYDAPAIQVGSASVSAPGRSCQLTAAPSTVPILVDGRDCHSAPVEYTSTCRSNENDRASKAARVVPGRLPPPRPPPPPPPPPPPATGTS